MFDPLSTTSNGPDKLFSTCVLLIGPTVLTVESFSINVQLLGSEKSLPLDHVPFLFLSQNLAIANERWM